MLKVQAKEANVRLKLYNYQFLLAFDFCKLSRQEEEKVKTESNIGFEKEILAFISMIFLGNNKYIWSLAQL